jgi:uncharacterized protein
MPDQRFPLHLSLYVCLALALSALSIRADAATACVWRVTNVPAPFYLIGTVHALAGNDYPLPKAYDQALHDSKRLLLEIDPDPKSNFSHNFAKAAIYPQGDTIRRHVHPKTWEYVAKNFKISGWAGKGWRIGDYLFDTFDQMRPWAIAYMWGIHGYNDVFSEHGVDHYLGYQARRMGKQTAGLETDQEHIEVLRGMADIDSELLLLDTMVRGDKRREEFNKLRAGWKKGDLGPIIAEGERSRKLNLGGEIRLLDYRNLRWLKRIEAEIRSGQPTAIVVGTAHFCGPNNLIELLQKRGYKIDQL